MAGEVVGDDAMFYCEIWTDVIPPTPVRRPTVNQNNRWRMRRAPGSVGNSYAVDADLVLFRRVGKRLGKPSWWRRS